MNLLYTSLDNTRSMSEMTIHSTFLNGLLMMPILTKLVPSQHIYVFYEVKPFIVNRLIYANYISYNAEYD